MQFSILDNEVYDLSVQSIEPVTGIGEKTVQDLIKAFKSVKLVKEKKLGTFSFRSRESKSDYTILQIELSQ